MNVKKVKTAVKVSAFLTALVPAICGATLLTNFKTVYDTDFTSVGIGGMRGGSGDASINLSGVSGTVTEAWIYWHGLSNNSNTPETAISDVMFAGQNISGEFLGISSDNCWGYANSVAYRADVSAYITGDGTYDLQNFIQPNADINGLSLIVFFDDGVDANNKDVVIFDGNDSNIDNIYDPAGWDITLSGINYTSGSANMQMHVSDGQSFNDDAIVVNGNVIEGIGPVFDGVYAQDGGAPATTSGLLWDVRDFDVTSLLSPGSNNLNLTTGVNSDCLSCVLIAIELPAGAAPPPTNDVPVSFSLGLLGIGLLGLGAKSRRAIKLS